MSELAKTRKRRSGHRAYVTKKLSKVKELTGDSSPEAITALIQLKLTLTEKIETITKLDEAILDLATEDADIEQEIEDSSEVKDEIYGGIAAIDEKLASHAKEGQPNPSTSHERPNYENTNRSDNQITRVRLPKLEVKKLSGNVHEWSEFWDSFTSAIHNNKSLSDVDKFAYLRELLEEPAKSAIAGFSTTEANYSEAVELLRRRFGNKTIVQRAHINELMNVRPVFNPKDTRRLRNFVDMVETNYRGLEALKVDEQTYAAIVVTSILNKLPDIVRLTITRGENYLEWTMANLVKALLAEVELRESHALLHGEEEEGDSNDRRKHRQPRTTSALFTRGEERGRAYCPYCLGNHKPEECKKVTNKTERVTLLKKYNRCFNCLRKGHLARQCKERVKCSACGGSHNTSICEKRRVERESGPVVNTNPSNLHVGTSSRVALQTAQGVVREKKRKRVRVLFDSGSQKSFVTARLMSEAGLSTVRKEWLEISTFGGS